MSKILIEGNKVIIDGHASDLETCNTLTNLCDELCKSEKFRTVKYERGYGEFESVVENEEKKFAADYLNIHLYSNDGTTLLVDNQPSAFDDLVVVPDGIIIREYYHSHNMKRIYTYSGSKKFMGISRTVGATSADFLVGSSNRLDVVLGDTGAYNLYIVENTIFPEHHSSLNELFTNIANAIREKTGDTASIVADDFPDAIWNNLQMKVITCKVIDHNVLSEKGMTWEEHINSIYNGIGNNNTLFLQSNMVYNGPKSYLLYQGNPVYKTDYIMENGLYTQVSTCCFIGGSQVQIDLNGSTKNIEDIKAGDNIVSYNKQNNTYYNARCTKPIINNCTTDIAEVRFDNGVTLVMNAYHPILCVDGFHSITNYDGYKTLSIGDKAICTDGSTKVIDINRYTSEPIVTYSLAVSDYDELVDDDTNDTYIVEGIVVHNAGSACPN